MEGRSLGQVLHCSATTTEAVVQAIQHVQESLRALAKLISLERLILTAAGDGRALAASHEEAMVVDHLVDIGRRNAVERTAHFLLELSARLKLVGLGTKQGYACPLSQYMLADALV